MSATGAAPGWVVEFLLGRSEPCLYEHFGLPDRWGPADETGLPRGFVPFWQVDVSMYGWNADSSDYVYHSLEEPVYPLRTFGSFDDMLIRYVSLLAENEIDDDEGRCVAEVVGLGRGAWDRLTESLEAP